MNAPNQAVRTAELEVIEYGVIATDTPAVFQREAMKLAASQIAAAEKIPLSGLTLLGGKWYCNSTALDVKLDNICREKNWEKSRVEVKFISESLDREGGNLYRCGFQGFVEMFDKATFMEALRIIIDKMPPDKVTPDFIKDLRDMFTYKFGNDGWAGTESVKMGTLKNKDMLRMMAATRALNRAKRQATGTGLTSFEELEVEPPLPEAQKTGRIEREDFVQPTQTPQATVADPAPSQASAPRKVVFVDWQDADTAHVHGYTVESDFRAEVEKCLAIWLPKRKMFTVPAPHVADVVAVCEKYGYEVEESLPRRTIDMKTGPEPQAAPQSQPLYPVVQVRGPKTASNGKQYFEVNWNGRWFFVFEDTAFVFNNIAATQGMQASFLVKDDPKFPKITGFVQVGDRKFESDGVTAFRDVNEMPGESLFP